jgi:hypothetical protein
LPVRLLVVTCASAIGLRVSVVCDEVTLINPVRVAMSEPSAFVAVRVTVYVPPPLYVWLGFWSVDPFALPDPGSPKFQLQDVGLPVDVSVKLTTRGAVPLVGAAVNEALGAVPTLT